MSNQPPPAPATNEQQRLDLLEQVLSEGSPLHGALNLIAEAVALALDVPMAFVTLVGREQQHLFAKSSAGAGMPNSTSLDYSFCRHVVAARAPLIVDTATEHPLVEDNPAIEAMGVAAYAGEPITVHGQVLGSLCVMDTESRHWSDHQVAMLRALADVVEFLTEARLGAEGAVGASGRGDDPQRTARLAVFEGLAEERNQVQALNRRLQHALLPRPTAPDGLAVEVFYQPGSDRLLLGGDFVDTRPAGSDRLDFVIGDVTGQGPEAAALAISLRSSWRALRTVGISLAQVAAVLDEQTAEAALYATVLVGSLTRDGGLTLVNAGHPSPVAVGADGVPVELAGVSGPMLGLGLESTVWTATEHQLGARTLLAYTDGLIEGRIHQSSERFGIDRLLATIAEVGPEPELLCRAATAANHEPLPDDVAILRIDRV